METGSIRKHETLVIIQVHTEAVNGATEMRKHGVRRALLDIVQ